MFQTIGDAYQIAKKDIMEFIRDRAQLISFIIMPIFMMVMMEYLPIPIISEKHLVRRRQYRQRQDS